MSNEQLPQLSSSQKALMSSEYQKYRAAANRNPDSIPDPMAATTTVDPRTHQSSGGVVPTTPVPTATPGIGMPATPAGPATTPAGPVNTGASIGNAQDFAGLDNTTDLTAGPAYNKPETKTGVLPGANANAANVEGGSLMDRLALHREAYPQGGREAIEKDKINPWRKGLAAIGDAMMAWDGTPGTSLQSILDERDQNYQAELSQYDRNRGNSANDLLLQQKLTEAPKRQKNEWRMNKNMVSEEYDQYGERTGNTQTNLTANFVAGSADKIEKIQLKFAEAVGIIDNGLAALDEGGGGIKDIEAMYAQIKAIDINSVVKGEEIRLLQEARSDMSQAIFRLKKVAQDRALTGAERQQIAVSLKRLRDVTTNAGRGYNTRARAKLEKMGVNPELLGQNTLFDKRQEAPGQQQGGKVKVSNGREEFYIDRADLKEASGDGFKEVR